MPSRVIREPPRVILEHNGVTIYETYMLDDAEQPEQYVFSTDPKQCDSTHPRCFDVREWAELVSVQAMKTEQPPLVDKSNARRRGMELADYTITPEYIALRVMWDEWWATTLPNLILQALREAIDTSIIK